MATSKIAAWSTSLNPACIPPSTYEAALRSLYNYLGCTLHGSSHQTVHRALSAIESLTTIHRSPDTRGPALLGTPYRLDAQHAALVNGIASHVHDYDDTHLATIIHPTGPVASALLAYIQSLDASTPVSGITLLTALTLGIEVSCKLGLSVWPRHYDTGWHITSTTGSIGAAAAVAKLMNLSTTQTAHALGIAATQVTGLRCHFGSDTKSFHVGRAAQNGLLAATLARAGFTAAEDTLEAPRGWANVLVGGDPNEAHLTKYVAQLGTTWEIARNSFKPFPCGIVAHPGIDAAVRARAELTKREPDANVTRSVRRLRWRALVHPLVLELTGTRHPRDGLQAKFSVFHGVAVGLLYGKAGPAEYDDKIVADPDVVAVRDAVDVQADTGVAADATVLMVFGEESGSVGDDSPLFTVNVEHAVGSIDVPMSKRQLTDKFVDQVSLSLGGEAAAELSEVCWNIGEVDDVSKLLEHLSSDN